MTKGFLLRVLRENRGKKDPFKKTRGPETKCARCTNAKSEVKDVREPKGILGRSQ